MKGHSNLIDPHGLHGEQQVVRGAAAQVGRVVRRAAVLQHGAAVEAVGVARAQAPRAPRALPRRRLRRPHHAPRARARRVVVHPEGIIQTGEPRNFICMNFHT